MSTPVPSDGFPYDNRPGEYYDSIRKQWFPQITPDPPPSTPLPPKWQTKVRNEHFRLEMDTKGLTDFLQIHGTTMDPEDFALMEQQLMLHKLLLHTLTARIKRFK